MDQFSALKTFYLKKARRHLTRAEEALKTLVRLEATTRGGSPRDYSPALGAIEDIVAACATAERIVAEDAARRALPVDPFETPETP